ERAALGALVAAGAGLGIDVRVRALRLLQHLGEGAEVVVDGLGRADHAAGAAVDAEVRVDDVEQLAFAGDGVRRAAGDARRATDARLDDVVRHGERPLAR